MDLAATAVSAAALPLHLSQRSSGTVGMKKFLQIYLGIFGVTAIFIALLHILLGPAAIPGAIPVNATMDSEDRFYATLFAAYGVAMLWCIKDIEQKSQVVYFLALTFLAGGFARLVSIAAVGLPNSFFITMTVAHSFPNHVPAAAHCKDGKWRIGL
jgi:hypothetical protein